MASSVITPPVTPVRWLRNRTLQRFVRHKLAVCLSVCLSICLSGLSVWPSVCLSVCLYVCVCVIHPRS